MHARSILHVIMALTTAPGGALVSCLHRLQDIQDSTLGSVLSALIQHCEPPQRTFPLERGLAPPWWPTGREAWWGLQGEAQGHQGVPPYRKPHDLKKAWKISLLSAAIKHMSSRFDQMPKLVWQRKRLQQKMSAKDTDTRSMILRQEEVLSRRLKTSPSTTTTTTRRWTWRSRTSASASLSAAHRETSAQRSWPSCCRLARASSPSTTSSSCTTAACRIATASTWGTTTTTTRRRC
jgi:hypothetical protein